MYIYIYIQLPKTKLQAQAYLSGCQGYKYGQHHSQAPNSQAKPPSPHIMALAPHSLAPYSLAPYSLLPYSLAPAKQPNKPRQLGHWSQQEPRKGHFTPLMSSQVSLFKGYI